ncbi:MAG: hypothetical protein QXM25_00825, partial [Nitrososphaerales archaeon]
SYYEKLLKSSYVMKELYQLKDLPKIFRDNPRLFSIYPDLINYIMKELFSMDGELRRVKSKKIIKMIRQRVGFSKLLLDLIKASKLFSY